MRTEQTMRAAHTRLPSHLELMRALTEILHVEILKHGNVVRLESALRDDWTSFSLVDLEIEFADSITLRLLLKDLSLTNLHETARRVKPAFVYEPLREIKTYEQILSQSRFGTAHHYGSAVRPEEDRYWLFLERISGFRISAVNTFRAWLEAARWLARLHARFIGKGDLLRRTVPLLRHDTAFYKLWRERALMFHSAKISRPIRGSLKLGYDRAIERLLEHPPTFIHGEFFASNIFVEETQTGCQIRPVDWEMAAVGPGLVDLAALSSGAWPESERTQMAAAYHDTLLSVGALRVSLEELLSALDDCRLYLAIQWLGWAPDWRPPPDAAHDWLAEAIALVAKMRAH